MEPQPRWKHAAFGVGLKHLLWGGRDDSSADSEIQCAQIDTFDVSTAKWEKPRLLQGSIPDHLDNMAVTTDGHMAYSFGGWNGTTCINAVYEINLLTLQCRAIPPESSFSPPGISGSRIVYFNEKLVAYGGYTKQRPYTDDLYVFDLKKSECGTLGTASLTRIWIAITALSCRGRCAMNKLGP